MLAANSVSAASIKYDGSGNILGVNGIDIGGTSYDATFSDTFNGTTYDKDFSKAASIALLNEFKTPVVGTPGVFSFTKTDLFHDTRIVGFESALTDYNRFVTPYTFYSFANGALGFLQGYSTYNGVLKTNTVNALTTAASILSDSKDHYEEGTVLQLDSNGKLTVARVDAFTNFVQWKESVSPVPVPAAAYLFAPALMGFVALRRKAKKA
jgi:hypothetical protein